MDAGNAFFFPHNTVKHVKGGVIVSIQSFFSLLGGLALFLYGMQMMSTNLEAAAGSRMKQILERLTANRFLGVIVGAGITQSSSPHPPQPSWWWASSTPSS